MIGSIFSERCLRALLLAFLCIGACTGASEPLAFDSNTNWMKQCEYAADCGDELACLCGLCVHHCDPAQGDVHCHDLHPEAACTSTDTVHFVDRCEPETSGICVQGCASNAPCAALSANLHCSEGICQHVGSNDFDAGSWLQQLDASTARVSDAASTSDAARDAASTSDAARDAGAATSSGCTNELTVQCQVLGLHSPP